MTTPANRMIVPAYWAEASLRNRTKQKQVTVRRFGWSDVSQQEAQAHADARAQEALQRALSGEKKFLRREPKVAYNGAHGVPIREEIVSRHGDSIITRNSYGARCLNTPNVVFADIDYASRWSGKYFLITLAAAMLIVVMAYANTHSGKVLGFGTVAALLLSSVISSRVQEAVLRSQGGAEKLARSRLNAFLKKHPNWKLRLYQTPAGLRVLVCHATFEPSDAKVTEFFSAIGTDVIYQRMCMNQQCFRARVSAKPWRIGIESHMKPRPGTWPVAEDKLPMRAAWIDKYEEKARSHAACRYVETLGKGITHPDVQAVQELHDELCDATSQKPLA